ncbi:MAG: lamin tail domain-containing protein [Candidatus Roizmanbacteria bacterium]
MSKHSLACATVCFSYLLLAPFALALEITELFPAPSSGDKEWVELYNNTDQSEDLSHFSLEDETGKKLSIASSSLSPSEYTKAESTNILNNTGDTIILKKDGSEIQRVSYTGSFTSSQSYGICSSDNSWKKMAPSPSSQNSCSSESPPESVSNSPSSTNSPVSQSSENTDYQNIFVTEVFPYPESGNEWVELYNNNDSTVSLTDWYIDDSPDGGSSPVRFTLSIGPKSYGSVDSTSSLFNNVGDSVSLLNASKTLKYSLSYGEATKGQSMGTTSIGGSSMCAQIPSKSSTNFSCITKIPPPSSSSSKSLSSPTTSTKSSPTSKVALSNQLASSTSAKSKISLNAPSPVFALENKKASSKVLGAKDTQGGGYKKQIISNRQKTIAGIALFVSIITSAAIMYTVKKKLSSSP